MLVSTLFTLCVIGLIILLTVLDIIKKRERNKIDDYPRNTRKDLIGLLFLDPEEVPAYKTFLTILYVSSICYIVGITINFLVNNWNNTLPI
jgi:uncharacterized membrane protein SpoIIM required for sporulation